MGQPHGHSRIFGSDCALGARSKTNKKDFLLIKGAFPNAIIVSS
jgi:hypothetical protein